MTINMGFVKGYMATHYGLRTSGEPKSQVRSPSPIRLLQWGWKLRFPHQELVDGAGGAAAFGDRPDDQ